MPHDNPAKSSSPPPVAWQRWQPDSLAKPPAASANADAAVPPAPTFAELEKLRETVREEARQQGYQDGLASGHAEGLRAGHAEAQTALREQAAQLAAVLTQFDEATRNIEQAVADELLSLTLAIARQVVGQAVQAQPGAILDVIHAALAELPLQHALIHLHPQDAALVRSLAGDQLAHAGHRLHEDAQLQRGDVLIDVGQTQLDAKLATRWQRTIAALTQDPDWLNSTIGRLPGSPDSSNPPNSPV
jgi:flagellar assembly protein FliH